MNKSLLFFKASRGAQWTMLVGASWIISCLLMPAAYAETPAPTTVLAALPEFLAGPMPDESTRMEPPSLFGDKTEITVGIGPVGMPRYLGSEENRVNILPTLSLYRGIFFIDSVRGLGAEYLTESGTYISAALSYDFGRTERDSDWRPGSKRLAGMGEVDGSTLVSVLAAQQITSWLSVNGDADFRVGGQRGRGNRYRLGLEATLLDGQHDELRLGLSVHGGSRDYNQTYFGVSTAQSLRSRFSAFTSGSGVHAHSLTLDWIRDLDRHWSVLAGVNLMRFGHKARHSPVVERRTGVTGTLMVNYTF